MVSLTSPRKTPIVYIPCRRTMDDLVSRACATQIHMASTRQDDFCVHVSRPHPRITMACNGINLYCNQPTRFPLPTRTMYTLEADVPDQIVAVVDATH